MSILSSIGKWYCALNQYSRRWKGMPQVMVKSGECFGEFPLFDDGLYAATAISDRATAIYRLPKESFIQLLNEHPNIHFKFSRLLVQRLRFKFMILDEFSHQDPEHLIFSLLNYFRQSKKNICPETHLVKLTRQQIADMTALRVETVIRTMRQMHTTGKIQIHRGRVFFPFMTEVISN